MTEKRKTPNNEVMYSESELHSLIERGEGQFLEFKSCWDRSGERPKPHGRRALRDKITEVVAAFANSDGGVLLVGIEDDGRISGHAYPEAAVEGFLSAPVRRLRADISLRTARIHVQGHEVLVFETLIAPEAVMVEGNGFPYRVGAEIVREPQEVINERKQAYLRVGYEARFRHDATLDNLDLEAARSFFAQTPVAGRAVTDALQHYRLIEWGLSTWRLRNAALLLFGRRSDFRWHFRAGIRLFRVAGTERRHGRHRNVAQLGTLEPPIARALEDAMLLGHAQVRRREVFNGTVFEDHAEYPEFVWKEAIVNAVAHRDYGIESREIEVWFYDDRLEVTSPGGIVPPATEHALNAGHPSHASRNPILTRALAGAAYMRDEGEGIPRIFEEMRDKSLPPPRVKVEGGIFTIRLFNSGVAAAPEAS